MIATGTPRIPSTAATARRTMRCARRWQTASAACPRHPAHLREALPRRYRAQCGSNRMRRGAGRREFCRPGGPRLDQATAVYGASQSAKIRGPRRCRRRQFRVSPAPNHPWRIRAARIRSERRWYPRMIELAHPGVLRSHQSRQDRPRGGPARSRAARLSPPVLPWCLRGHSMSALGLTPQCQADGARPTEGALTDGVTFGRIARRVLRQAPGARTRR